MRSIFDHKENQNQKFLSIPDFAVKTNLVAPADCCRLQWGFVLNCGSFHIQDAIEIYMHNIYLKLFNSAELR